MSTESPAEAKHLVSIICRTLGRAELQQALQSVAAQSYPNIELVLVDAAGTNSLNYESAAKDISVNLVSSGQPLNRSQAANAGLDAAKGKYILFLDDDDWIDVEHVNQLVHFLDGNGEFRAAYSSTRKTDAAGNPVNYSFQQDFDPVLLMRDNYIPIHAILFDSALLEQGCRFDEAFDIYEDWDFWLQLSQHTDFHHIDTLTAFYREGGDSDTAAENVRLRYQSENILAKARAAIFDKWLPQWSGERVNALIGQLDQSVLVCEQNAQIHTEMQRNAELQDKLAQSEMQITELNQQISELDRQIDHKDSQLEQLQQHNQEQVRHVKVLEATLDAIYKSKSWKIMGPVRRVARVLTPDAAAKTDASEPDK